MARLITIGDSISQGFMSAGAARTELAYSGLVARALGATPDRDYHVPRWPLGGLPFNLEVLLRHLGKSLGDDIFGPLEWTAAVFRINGFLDKLEDYYERNEGDYRRPYVSPVTRKAVDGFHNLASFGFTVSDAWQLTPNTCLGHLEPGGVRPVDDEFFGTPSDAFYRSAYRVLNPADRANRRDFSQLDWLRHYAESEGVENAIVWLGANNALGTVLHLDIQEAKMSPAEYAALGHNERGRFNLFTEELFAQDYEELLRRLDEALGSNKHGDWKVFLGTVPPVTVAPIAKGVGGVQMRDDPFGVVTPKARYYEHYVYFIFGAEGARSGKLPSLSADQAYYIDCRIAAYNRIIRDLVRQANDGGRPRFFVVDTAKMLLDAAFKRNGGHPVYPFPDALRDRGRPVVTTQYYRARDGRVSAGGLFSLDGVHPTAIGQALVAQEFLNSMKQAGVQLSRPDLPWEQVKSTDDLYSRPLGLVEELFQHRRLARFLISRMRSEPEAVDDSSVWDDIEDH